MEIKNLELIGQRGSAEVFKLDNRRVLKVPKYLTRFDEIGQQFYIQQQLFNGGIRVPEPLEIIFVKDRGLEKRSMIMEFIEGKSINDLGIIRKIIAKELYRAELEKAVLLGFIPQDSEDLQNAIYSKRNGMYLIDFEGWEYRK